MKLRFARQMGAFAVLIGLWSSLVVGQELTTPPPIPELPPPNWSEHQVKTVQGVVKRLPMRPSIKATRLGIVKPEDLIMYFEAHRKRVLALSEEAVRQSMPEIVRHFKLKPPFDKPENFIQVVRVRALIHDLEKNQKDVANGLLQLFGVNIKTMPENTAVEREAKKAAWELVATLNGIGAEYAEPLVDRTIWQMFGDYPAEVKKAGQFVEHVADLVDRTKDKDAIVELGRQFHDPPVSHYDPERFKFFVRPPPDDKFYGYRYRLVARRLEEKYETLMLNMDFRTYRRQQMASMPPAKRRISGMVVLAAESCPKLVNKIVELRTQVQSMRPNGRYSFGSR